MLLTELEPPRDETDHLGRVLIVEDDGTAAVLLEAVVTAMGYATTRASTGLEAEQLAQPGGFDLVLLDLDLPDIAGFEVARRLRRSWTAERLPIIFVSGEHDPEARVQAFDVGGADFITKPYHIPEVRARVHHQLETRRLRQELELSAEILEQRVRDRTAELSHSMTELQTEVEVRRGLEEDLRRLADTDPVTGLLNQRGLPRQLDSWRADTASGLVVATEVDGWESITGVLGHRDADLLVDAVAARISSTETCGPAGRLGGSLIITALAPCEGNVKRCVESLRRRLQEPIAVNGRSMRLTFSMGVVHDTAATVSTSDLLRDATLALHAAKQQPGDTVVLSDEQRAALADDLSLEQELWGAADRDELKLEYQPLFDLATLRRTGFEALLRWTHPRRGVVSPGRFIPIAERSGAIDELGPWTLSEATRQLSRWRRDGILESGVTVAVNLSTVEAIDLDLPARVLRALEAAGLGPDALEVELTETAVLRQGQTVGQVLGALHDAGVRICLDDFGTGSSSLTVLQQIPADVVKIDRSFVSAMVDDPHSRAIVESTIGLAHRLGKQVVGEGVETLDQLDLLRDFGCDRVQGFLLSRPVDAARAPHLRRVDVSAVTG